MKKYALTLCLSIVDTDTGETIEGQTETEYFETIAAAEKAAAEYLTTGTAGEYSDGTEAKVISAEVNPEPQEFDPF